MEHTVNEHNLDQSVDDRMIKIIGVEFNITGPNGALQEMAMFVPNGHGLLIPRLISGGRYSAEYRPLVTFHSTVGDYTIGRNEWGCPW